MLGLAVHLHRWLMKTHSGAIVVAAGNQLKDIRYRPIASRNRAICEGIKERLKIFGL